MKEQEKAIFVPTEKGGINVHFIKRYVIEGGGSDESVLVTYDEEFNREVTLHIHGGYAMRAKSVLREWTA